MGGKIARGWRWVWGAEPRKTRRIQEPVGVPVESPGGVGVCFSGGGVRSASFSLGALQGLQRAGAFPSKVTAVSAVSGGCYPLLGWLATAGYSDQHSLRTQPSWSPNSPEENHLRANLDFMAQGATGKAFAVVTFLAGLVLNALPVFLSLVLGGYVVARVAVHPLHSGLTLVTVGHLDDIAPLLSFAVVAALVILAANAVAMVIQNPLHAKRHRSTRVIRRFSLIAAFGVVGLLSVEVALPGLVWIYRASLVEVNALITGEGAVSPRDISSTDFPGFRRMLPAGVLLGAIFGSFGASLAWWSYRHAEGKVLSVFAPVVLLSMLLFPIAIGASHALSEEPTVNGIALLVALASLAVLLGAFVSTNQYSLHSFYRDRLASVFIVKRGADGTIETVPDARMSVAFAEARAHQSLPNFLICAAQNTNARESPRGSGAVSFLFTPEECGPHGSMIQTEVVEGGSGFSGSALTLQAMMAISGAAVSPLMGRNTRPFLRSIFSLLNIRLGVWLPNEGSPHIERFRAERDARSPVEKHADVTSTQAPAESPGRPSFRGWFRRLGRMEPGAIYTMREAFGLVSRGAPFSYVTDGGHWDNLGLVELLRTGVTTAICFDSSFGGDGPSHAFAHTIRLLRTELGIELVKDGASESSEMLTRYRGTALSNQDHKVDVFYVRPTRGAGPLDSVVQADVDPSFPHHATQLLFFANERFESYRALGLAAADEVVREVHSF